MSFFGKLRGNAVSSSLPWETDCVNSAKVGLVIAHCKDLLPDKPPRLLLLDRCPGHLADV